MLATGSGCGNLKVWNTASGRERATFQTDGRPIRNVFFSQDGGLLIEVKFNGLVMLWDIGEGSKKTLLWAGTDSCSAAISPDARFLALGGADGIVRVWDLNSTAGGATGEPRPIR